MLYKYLEAVLELLYPGSSLCIICGKEVEGQREKGLCSQCFQKILNLSVQKNRCFRCGHFNGENPCINCSHWEDILIRVISVTPYEGIYKDLIQNIKYGADRTLAVPLGYLMSARFKMERIKVDVIIPVPLHPRREMERGFNQSLILAQEIAVHLRKPILLDILTRVKYEKPQSGLDWKNRQKIKDKTFIVKNNEKIKGKTILLIDDIITSGATMFSCAKTLYDNEIAAVYGLTWAAGIGNISWKQEVIDK